MNKIFFSLAVCVFLLLGSCKKSNSSITASAVSNTISSGSWRVTYYWDTDHDETANYSGYAFNFTPGSVTAVRSGTTITGTWTTTTDDSKPKLVLAFSTPASFVEISDDWHVIERTDTKIRLQDVSGGNGGTDYLTFERN